MRLKTCAKTVNLNKMNTRLLIMPLLELTKGKQVLTKNKEILKITNNISPDKIECDYLNGDFKGYFSMGELFVINLITFKSEFVDFGSDPSGEEQLKLDVKNTNIYPLKESQWNHVIKHNLIDKKIDFKFKLMAKTVTKGTNEFDFYEEDVVNYAEILI